MKLIEILWFLGAVISVPRTYRVALNGVNLGLGMQVGGYWERIPAFMLSCCFSPMWIITVPGLWIWIKVNPAMAKYLARPDYRAKKTHPDPA